MEPRHQVSRAAIDLIKRCEGLRREAAQLDDGRWTIGYGHTRNARPEARVDEADAEALLLYDLIGVAHAVNEWTYAPLNQQQFDALVSFAFNIGLENFQRSLTLRRLNEGRTMEAALAMELWRCADLQGERIVVDALVRRRAWEKTLFLKPVDAWAPAPSPVVRPKLDYDAVAAMPSRAPSLVTTRMDGERATAEPYPPSHAPAGPTGEAMASEAAAASVLSRLEAIDPLSAESAGEEDCLTAGEEPFPTAPAPAGDAAQATIAAVVDSAPQTGPDPAQTRHETSADGGPFPLFLLGLAGVGLFIIAVTFGFRSPVHGGAPFAGGLFGWVFGTAGVACFALAAYFLLVRLGEGERPASR